MNMDYRIILLAASSVFLLERLVGWIRMGFKKDRPPGFEVHSLTERTTSFGQRAVRILAGAGLVWGFEEIGLPSGFVLAVLLLFLFVLERFLFRARSLMQSGDIAFFDTLKENIGAGVDFFDALAVACEYLSRGVAREGVSISLRRFSERANLIHCLEPLVNAGPFLAGLAADVRRTGWEYSPALVLSVQQMHERVAAAWEKGHRSRRRLRILEQWQPIWIQFALGMAGIYIVLRFDMILLDENLLSTVGFGLLIYSLVYAQRTVLMGFASGIFILALWGTLIWQQMPVNLPDPIESAQEEMLPQIRNNLKQASLVGSNGLIGDYCQVSTGFDPGWARIRSGPTMSAGSIGFASEGDVLEMLAPYESGWLQVRSLEGLEGWIYSLLCEVFVEAP
jgi:hypothetical protein